MSRKDNQATKPAVSKKPKQTRDNLAQKIGREETIHEKLEVALGRKLSPPWFEQFQDDKDFLSLAEVSHYWAARLNEGELSQHDAEQFDQFCSLAGQALWVAIVGGEDRFFSKLAGLVQSQKRQAKLLASDQRRAFYTDILKHCWRTRTGTREKHCNPIALLRELNQRGWQFSVEQDGQTPRSLKRTCPKLGVHLMPLAKARLASPR